MFEEIYSYVLTMFEERVFLRDTSYESVNVPMAVICTLKKLMTQEERRQCQEQGP
jgi:hypothetical protein